MRTISLLQPWAGLLVLGLKKFETRSWNTKHRGPLLIHSSANLEHNGKRLLEWLCHDMPDVFYPGSDAYETCVLTGHVLGQVNIVDAHSTNGQKKVWLDPLEKLFGDYSPDRWFWECHNPISFPFPYPAKGKLQLWDFQLQLPDNSNQSKS